MLLFNPTTGFDLDGFLKIVPGYDKVDTYTSIVKGNTVQVVFAEPEEYDELSPKAAQNFYETLKERK